MGWAGVCNHPARDQPGLGKLMRRIIDLTGQRFGRLTVIRRGSSVRPGQTCWWCGCDCGEVALVRGRNLRNGDTKSCGCLRKELTRIRVLEGKAGKGSRQGRELPVQPGQIYGLLTVIRRGPHRKNTHTAFWCECSCGKKCVLVAMFRLLNGRTKSCGCHPAVHRGLAIPYQGETLSLLAIARREGVGSDALYYHAIRKGIPIEDALKIVKGLAKAKPAN